MGQGTCCIEAAVEAQVVEQPASDHCLSHKSSSSSSQHGLNGTRPRRLSGPAGVGEHKTPNRKASFEASENEEVSYESPERSTTSPQLASTTLGTHLPPYLDKERQPVKLQSERARTSSTYNRSSSRSHMPPDIVNPRNANQAFEVRMRLFNFNMGNSDNFSSLGDLQGPGGRGLYQTHWKEPFADGSPVDIVFTTLAETRLNLTDWIHEYQDYLDSHSDERLNAVTCQNARREGGKHTKSNLRSFAEKIGAHYSGNLKTLLAFNTDILDEDADGDLFGRLEEGQIAGITIPNPKKAFIGRSLSFSSYTGVADVRICFTGAHFPIARLAHALECQTDDVLNQCKIAFARSLRRVLKKASDRGLLDHRTLLIVQGDLNTRTVLHNGEVRDVLLEILQDSDMQAALIHELDVPCGRWLEPVSFGSPLEMPVTYKFHENVECKIDELTVGMIVDPVDPVQSAAAKSFRASGATSASVGLSRSASPPSKMSYRSLKSGTSLLGSQKNSSGKISSLGSVKQVSSTKTDKSGAYRASLNQLGDEKLEEWGLQYKKHDFRAFRFPASPDRVICWVPDGLEERLTWHFPRTSYEVNYQQQGSDHRPVTLDVLLQISPSPTSLTMCESDDFFSSESKGRASSRNVSVATVAKMSSMTSTASARSTTKISLSIAFENSMRANPSLRENFLEISKADAEKDDDAESDNEGLFASQEEDTPVRVVGRRKTDASETVVDI